MSKYKWTKDDTRDNDKEAGNEPSSDKDIASAEHQARNDYQDSGEPFGSLTNRNREDKEDVPSKPE
jgi:hypothetical protein